MKNMTTRYSVCIATYNGEKYIREQISSILEQLGEEDEVIISDDFSTDNTLPLIRTFNDRRIKVFQNNRFRSPIFNFECCLSKAIGNIIFLSDQDDVWLPGKVDTVAKAFTEHQCDVVVSDAVVVNEHLDILHKSFYGTVRSGPGIIKNISKNSYLGCTMAVRRKILDIALPFPTNIPMHDMWLGLIAELFGSTVFITNKLILYRRHADTVTTNKHASISRMIKWRFFLITNLLLRYLKYAKIKRNTFLLTMLVCNLWHLY